MLVYNRLYDFMGLSRQQPQDDIKWLFAAILKSFTEDFFYSIDRVKYPLKENRNNN